MTGFAFARRQERTPQLGALSSNVFGDVADRSGYHGRHAGVARRARQPSRVRVVEEDLGQVRFFLGNATRLS